MSRKKRNTKDSKATSWERTGEKDFIVKHDDGSIFECKVDDPKKFDAMKGMSHRSGKIISFGGIGEKKPLICDNCKKKVHRITVRESKSLCPDCS